MARLFPGNVGVSPGTTTMRIAGTTVSYVKPYASGIVELKHPGFGAIDTRSHLRWDVIGIVGGLSLIIALGTGLLASAIGNR